jgi:starch synthase
MNVAMGPVREEFTLLEGRLGDGGGAVYAVDHPGFFDRDAIYGDRGGDYPDNLRRFAFFGRAASEVAASVVHPDVLHAHDWHAALAPLAARADHDIAARLRGVLTVFTVHNLAFQGIFASSEFPILNLEPSYLSVNCLEFYGRMNLVKGAVALSDGVSTVSPSYAGEILEDPEIGFGLEGVFRARADRFRGILNGADYDKWDPSRDPLITANYDGSRPEGKRRCKSALRAELGLTGSPDAPIIAMISRLTPQKGVDLMSVGFDAMMQSGIELVILGSGEPAWEDFFHKQVVRYPGRLSVRLGFDEALAHRIQAGADIFLMPSRFEPCGLTQMYAMRYGTVPVVRATGGLRDTVADFDRASGIGTGFVFADYRADAFVGAVHRAVATFRDEPAWRKLMLNDFAADFSWDRAAREYLNWFTHLRAAR